MTAFNVNPSTSSVPHFIHATACSCVNATTAFWTSFIFLPNFLPTSLKFGMSDNVTHSCSCSFGTTLKSHVFNSDRIYVFNGPVIPATTCSAGSRKMTVTFLTGNFKLILRFSRAFRPCSTILCNVTIASTACGFNRLSSYCGNRKKCTESLLPAMTGFDVPPPLAASA